MVGIDHFISPERVDFFVKDPDMSKVIFWSLLEATGTEGEDSHEADRLLWENEIGTDQVPAGPIMFTNQDVGLIQRCLSMYADTCRIGYQRDRKRSNLAAEVAKHVSEIVRQTNLPGY